MALIKITDLNPASSNTASDWIELNSDESESIHGGRRRQHRQAVNNLIDSLTSQIESIGTASNQGDNSFKLTISQSNSGGQSSTTINGVEVETSGNIFYTSSGIAPMGGVPIPGVPGGYTF